MYAVVQMPFEQVDTFYVYFCAINKQIHLVG